MDGTACVGGPGTDEQHVIIMLMMMILVMMILMMMMTIVMMMMMKNTLALQRMVTVLLKPFQAASCNAVFPCCYCYHYFLSSSSTTSVPVLPAQCWSQTLLFFFFSI